MSNTLILEDEVVHLSPLTLDNYHHLLEVASQEKLVQYSPSEISTPSTLKQYVTRALKLQEEGRVLPLIIFDKRSSKYAGTSRYMHIDGRNKTVEIGSTWIGREFHGSGLNSHMKKLMIDYAFEEMEMEKVEFRVDERNMRSRKAVEKLGAVLEGILRKNIYLMDGFKRNTCCYGILKEEWYK